MWGAAVTATMGNFARLRLLHLSDGVQTPADLWPGFTGPEFTDHARFGLDRILRDPGGVATVSAEPDEIAPSNADYAEGPAGHWKYSGYRARQTWMADDPHPDSR